MGEHAYLATSQQLFLLLLKGQIPKELTNIEELLPRVETVENVIYGVAYPMDHPMNCPDEDHAE